MVGDPRDRTAYAFGVAGIAVALVALIVGICWIAVERGDVTVTIATDSHTHKCPLGEGSVKCRPAVLTRREIAAPTAKQKTEIPKELWEAAALLGGVLVGMLIPFPFPLTWVDEIWSRKNAPAAIAALLAFVIGLVLVAVSSLGLLRLGIGGLLFGLLIPSPARGE